MAPTSRPATTGYERLAQADQISDDDSETEGHQHQHQHQLSQSFASLQNQQPAAQYAAITRPRAHSGITSPKAFRTTAATSSSNPHNNITGGLRRGRSNSGVDLKAINARLERWAEEIASKFKKHGRGFRGGGYDGEGEGEERLEIVYSVFQGPADGSARPVTAEAFAALPEPAMSRDEFDRIVGSVRTAIDQGMHPSMITQGSSGSYFARNTDGKIVGVFKPKDEEPYAAGNPKWNKWIHRNLFPCFFGRACLIPNLSYVSEAAAYTLDCQLRTNLVPHTEVIYLSSKSFHYPFWDRRAFYRKKKPLPAKPGSFQVFLKGFKDANVFLRENPWPEQYWSSGFRGGSYSYYGYGSGNNTTSSTTANGSSSNGNGNNDMHRNRRRRTPRWADDCRPTTSRRRTRTGAGGESHDSDDDEGSEDGLNGAEARRPPGPDNFVWTETLKQSFREELEKLVILDYIMRNTDRGLDNWMIKVDWEAQAVAIVSEPPQLNTDVGGEEQEDDDDDEQPARPVDPSQRKKSTAARSSSSAVPQPQHPYKAQQPMSANGAAATTPKVPDPKISIGAIDNSLSWPWKHPDAWRSFPFGWLFLPVDLIGRPFSQKTRDHFLPLLTSSQWWSETQYALRKDFQIDKDFQEKMFSRQIAVMKGQAWNVVETLKTPDHGPLELTRRPRVCVWDDLVDVPVAVPMRVTSSTEIRRKAGPELREAAAEEEMDIGAANSSSATSKLQGEDLLGLASPLPHPGRFELTTSPPRARSPEGAETTHSRSAPIGNGRAAQQDPSSFDSAAADALNSPESRPAISGYVPRASYQGPSRPQLSMYTPRRERGFSFGAGSRHNGHSIAQRLHGYDVDDDMEGDLGYAAAEGMEGNRRKVIVERLETVKARNPVFSWC